MIRKINLSGEKKNSEKIFFHLINNGKRIQNGTVPGEDAVAAFYIIVDKNRLGQNAPRTFLLTSDRGVKLIVFTGNRPEFNI